MGVRAMTRINEKLGLRPAGRRVMMALPPDRALAVRVTAARCPTCGRTGAHLSKPHPGSLCCGWCQTLWPLAPLTDPEIRLSAPDGGPAFPVPMVSDGTIVDVVNDQCKTEAHVNSVKGSATVDGPPSLPDACKVCGARWVCEHQP
jgi:hypothetical protein